MLFIIIKPRSSLLFPLGNTQLVVVGFTLSSTSLMDLLSVLKRGWLLKGTRRGVDYLETFSPVARLNSVRILPSFAVSHSWPLYQLDIKNAFLHGDLKEEVYMDQPPGYVVAGSEHLVCRLQKALYGLKQSPRAWFDRFSAVVLGYGFQRSTSNHSVFIRHSSNGTIVLIVYVDDIIISGSDSTDIADLKAYLSKHFHTKDLGALRYFLGIEVARSSQGISLSQRKYILDLLSETSLLGARPADTPMDSTVKLDGEHGELLMLVDIAAWFGS